MKNNQTTRDSFVADWINRHCEPGTTFAAASSDASHRRYFRLFYGDGSTAILMDAPPEFCSCDSFVNVARLLQSIGLNAPRLHNIDLDAGILVLDDFGQQLYLDVLKETPARAPELFRDAGAALIKWQLASKPDVLPNYDDALLLQELQLFPDWFIGRHLGEQLSACEQQQLQDIFTLLINNARQQPQTYVHRDYMPRNLMICQDNPGILDFQDAAYGAITYDVVSLFRDAFISWEEEEELDWVIRYWEKARAADLPVSTQFDHDFAQYWRCYELMGLQRHLKVVGIFCRLNYRDHKAHYITDLPRFFNYIRRVALRYKALKPLLVLMDRLQKIDPQVGYTF